VEYTVWERPRGSRSEVYLGRRAQVAQVVSIRLSALAVLGTRRRGTIREHRHLVAPTERVSDCRFGADFGRHAADEETRDVVGREVRL
jgi:hypothetical protein